MDEGPCISVDAVAVDGCEVDTHTHIAIRVRITVQLDV